MLNIQTLIALNGIFQLLLTAVVIVGWRQSKSNIDTRPWVICYVLTSCAFLLLLARDSLPSFLAIVVVNYLFAIGAYALVYGTRLFLGVKNLPASWLVTASVMFISFFIYFFYVSPNQQFRSLMIVGCLILIYSISAWDSLSRAGRRHPARILYGANCLLMIVAQCFSIISIVNLASGQGILPSSAPAQVYWVLVLINLVFTAISIVLLATERLSQNLRFYSEHDNLTSVFNRRIFLALLSKLLHAMKRNKTPAGLLFIDLDHFKQINDSHGHNTGDDVLRHFVALTQQQLRAEDTIGRMGGEEFSVILPNTARADAQNIAERIRLACETSSLVVKDKEIRFTVSIGLVNFDENNSEETLLELADKAMYKAKASGRNRVVAYA